MWQKSFNFSSNVFLNKAFFSISAITLLLISLEGNHARGNHKEIPGVSIARFALPSIPANTDVINPTGTPVGAKADEIKKILFDLENSSASMIQSTRDLYEKTIAEVNQYYLVAGEIEARLQLGTTPANPHLIELRNKALQQLDQIAGTIAMMNGLTAEFSRDEQQIKALPSHIDAALRMPGAVDEDHAHLILMSDELARVDAAIARIISIINANTQRQNEWLSTERVRFANLSSAIDRGHHLPLSQSSAPKLSYPKPVLPEVDSSPKKAPHAHLHKKDVEKQLEKKISSLRSSSKPLSLAPTTVTPQNATKKLSPPLKSPTPTTPTITPQDPTKKLPQPLKSPTPTTPTVTPQDPTKKQPQPLKATSALPDTQAPEKLSPTVAVTPHPKVHPVSEEENTPKSPQRRAEPVETISYSSAAKDRTPLALLEPTQNPKSHKWYLLSSVKRGLKEPSSVVDIITTGGEKKSIQAGEEVKSLLIEMGVRPEQIRLIHTKGNEVQAGQIYIFGR